MNPAVLWVVVALGLAAYVASAWVCAPEGCGALPVSEVSATPR